MNFQEVMRHPGQCAAANPETPFQIDNPSFSPSAA
jgi:hypothetical protein